MRAILVTAALLVFAGREVRAADDLDSALNSLKAADEQKDNDAVKKWAVETFRLSSAAGKGQAADAAAPDAESVKAAGQFAEYALCAAALRERDHAKTIELYEALEQNAPQSKYLPQLYSVYAAALAQAGKPDKAFVFAEKAIAKAPSNDDLLLMLANGFMTRKQWQRSATYGSKLAAVMSTKPRPANVPQADWDRDRTLKLGRGYYISGLSYAMVSNHIFADKNLRQALPYIKDENELKAVALLYLGLSNYNIARATLDRARMKEAIDFSKQASTIPGPVQEQARKNAWMMETDLAQLNGARR